MIEVEFNLRLAILSGCKRMELDIGEAAHLEQLIAQLGLTEEDVGMLFINKQWAPLDSVIHDGDFVQLYPELDGG